MTAAPSSTSPARWQLVASAMSKTGAASLASGLLSALVTKVLATQFGPAAVALLQSLQQTRQTALVAGTLNGQTALVQGASAREGFSRREYLRTAAWLFSAGTLAAVAVLLAAPGLVARFAGLPVRIVPWLALPVLLSSGFVFLSGLVNILGGIGRLAWLQVIAALATAVGVWPAARAMHGGQPQALVYLLSFSAAVSVLAALGMLARDRRRVFTWFHGPGCFWNAFAARHFLSISSAMLLAGLVSSASLLFVRARIIRAAGLAEAGQFDAAWNISMNHVTLVLGSMQAYCVPALAAARGAEQRGAHLRSVLTVAVLVATPVIVALALVKPWALTMLYSGAFHAAAACLRWTLVGDYLKVTSWILSLGLIAAADMKAFLLTDLAVYGVFAASSGILMRRFPAGESAAMAFVLMYAAHLGLCFTCLYRRHSFRPGRRTTAVWLAGLASVLGASWAAWGL